MTISRQDSCRKTTRVARVRPDRRSRFTVSLPLPTQGNPLAIYRVTVTIGRGTSYSLPIVVRRAGT